MEENSAKGYSDSDTCSNTETHRSANWWRWGEDFKEEGLCTCLVSCATILASTMSAAEGRKWGEMSLQANPRELALC